MNHTQTSFDRFVTIVAFLALLAPAASVRAQQQAKPIGGFPLGPKMDEIVPGRFIVDPPTIANLGFRWYMEGDSNRNASVAVAFRKKGHRRNQPDILLKWQDHNGHVGRYNSIEELFNATGLERHGMLTDYNIFINAKPPEKGRTAKPADYDLRLKPGANVIDAGTPLPQITDGFTGKAPDIGCHELGQTRPHYGPRSF